MSKPSGRPSTIRMRKLCPMRNRPAALGREIEGDLRQTTLSHSVPVFNIDGLIDPHARMISWRRDNVRVGDTA